MPVMKESPRTGTKCYIHEMQHPMELPYSRLQYHICWICQSRLLELAKIDLQFKLRGQLVIITTTSEVQTPEADPETDYKAEKTQSA